jgi:hypothetical protein
MWTLLNTSNAHAKAREAMYTRLVKDQPDHHSSRQARWPLGRFEDIRRALASHFANVSAPTGPWENVDEQKGRSPCSSLATHQTNALPRSQSPLHGSVTNTKSPWTDPTSGTVSFSSEQRSLHDLAWVYSPAASSVRQRRVQGNQKGKRGISKKRKRSTSPPRQRNNSLDRSVAPLSASEQLAKLFEAVPDQEPHDSQFEE